MNPLVYKKMYEHEDVFWWHKGMRKITEKLLTHYCKKGAELKILDVGCGTGGWFSLLSQYGSVYGIDRSDEAIHYARKRGIAYSVVQGNIDALPYENNTFDIISCFDVLYHKCVSDEQAVLHEIYRVLKQDGMLIIREASYDWLRSQHDTLVWTRHRFKSDELQLKLSAAGLIVIKCSYLNFFLFPIALVKRLFERILQEKNPLASMYSLPTLVNKFFYFFLLIESTLLPLMKFPFGLSIICIAKKPIQTTFQLGKAEPSIAVSKTFIE